MKRLFKYIFLLPLLLMVSCVYDEGLSIDDVLKVSDNTFEFTAAGDEIEFTIESYCGWEIKCEADWVSFSDYEGESKDVKNVLTVSENLSVNARTAQAEIVNDRYGINIKLNIYQEAGAPYIKTSSERLEFEEEGGVAEIKVESNVSWEASVDVDWVEISPKSGLSGVTTMTIDINKNTSVASRSAVIRIVNSEYEIEEKKLVVQSEFVPELKVNVEMLENISYNGSTEEIRIESNISWEASVDSEWITLSLNSAQAGTNTMVVEVLPNTTVNERTSVITLSNEEYGVVKEVPVTQSEFVPSIDISEGSIKSVPCYGTTRELLIESNISWEASVDSEWITLSLNSAQAGTNTMVVEVLPNTTVNERTSVITLSNEEYGVVKEVPVTQLEFVPYIEVKPNEFKNVDYHKQGKRILIESSVSWEASVDCNWIEIETYDKGQLGYADLLIMILWNDDSLSRSGVITISNSEYEISSEVHISQDSHYIFGHEYVDLGLPSGLKWATCNVGAENPEDYGDYYAWGETSTKSEYTEENSLTYGKSMSDISGNITYDVARKEWGSSWRLPTEKEFEELLEECEWIWTTQGGIEGYEVIGPSAESIFLPAAGIRDGSSLRFVGGNGYYWSSRPFDTLYAYTLHFNSSDHLLRTGSNSRYYGISVRPVSE